MGIYTLYHTDTGKIESVLRLTENSKQKMLDNNPGIAFLDGAVPDVNKYRVNVSAIPHTVELKPAPTIDVARHVRIERTKLLKLSDWTQTADSPLSDTKKAEWATYRQALRDMPANSDNWATINDIVWPSKPS